MRDECLKKAVLRFPGGVLQPYDEILGRVGFDAMIEFVEEFGGCQIYVPSKRTIFRECVESAIVVEFDGDNIKLLAKKYDYSVKGIRDIIRRKGA
jgi:Mor family transcriptional regulator